MIFLAPCPTHNKRRHFYLRDMTKINWLDASEFIQLRHETEVNISGRSKFIIQSIISCDIEIKFALSPWSIVYQNNIFSSFRHDLIVFSSKYVQPTSHLSCYFWPSATQKARFLFRSSNHLSLMFKFSVFKSNEFINGGDLDFSLCGTL